MRDRDKILSQCPAISKYFYRVLLFLFFASVFCSCDMGRFYANKRLGGNRARVCVEKTASENSPVRNDSMYNSLSQEKEIPVNPFTDPTQEHTSLQKVSMALQNSIHYVPQPKPGISEHKEKKTIIKIPHQVLSPSTNNHGGTTIWGILLYVLLICVEIGILVFLIAWIFKPALVAFHTALLVMLVIFVLFMLYLLCIGLFMGDRPSGTYHSH